LGPPTALVVVSQRFPKNWPHLSQGLSQIPLDNEQKFVYHVIEHMSGFIGSSPGMEGRRKEIIMAKKGKVSDRQKEILGYIWANIQKEGRPPTIREIGEAAQISSTSVVSYNLNKLKEQGYLEREKEVARGLRLTERARALFSSPPLAPPDEMLTVPLMGYIVAGEPVESFENYDTDDTVLVSTSILPRRSEPLFALRVRGNSMIDAMVADNDIVVLEPAHEARDGEMVAAWLPERQEQTLKYFHRDGDSVRLVPANPNMEPIVLHASEVQIQGKVKLVLRTPVPV
jgi:repressor LexA